MGKTANVPCRHKFSVVWEKDYSKVFYLQRHETGTLLTTTNELQGRSQISANSWLAPHQDSHFLENNSENLTTSFSQQGKAVFTAMDLSIQALRAEAKKSKYQKLLSFWVYLSVCCCAHKACYLRALQHKKQALCVTPEIWQAPISAGRRHVTVVSPDRDISFTAAQPSPVPYWGLIWYLFTARSNLLMVEEEAGGNPVSLDSCWLSLLWGWDWKAEAEVTLWAAASGKCVQSCSCNHVDVAHPRAVSLGHLFRVPPGISPCQDPAPEILRRGLVWLPLMLN